MTSHYSRRLLPLLDVMMLLFGLLIILIATANFTPGAQSVERAEPVSNAANAHDSLISDLLAGRTFVFLEVARDLGIRHVIDAEVYGRSLGNVEDFDETAFESLVTGAGGDEVTIIIFYLPGLQSQYFTPRLQDSLLQSIGEQRTLFARKPENRGG